MSEGAPSLPPGIQAEASGHAQQAILGQGVQHNHWYAAPVSGPGPRSVDTLVPPPPVMLGRLGELARLRAAALPAGTGRSVVISVVHGMGGAGKTALARALAAEVAADYPDARIEVDLYGFTPGTQPREPGEVLGELLGLAGVAMSEVPATAEGRAQLWRAWLSERRVLLLLDNARDAAQVLPLIPGRSVPGRSLVLLTSRNRLAELDPSSTIGLEMLPVEDAVALLVAAARRSRSEVAGTDAELSDLAAMCGRLPLALRSVGSLLAHLDPAELIEVMRAARHPFEHLAAADQAAEAAFTVSHDALPTGLQDTLRACAWHPGPDFDANSIAALTDRPRGLITVQLVDLLEGNLLSGLPRRRYTFHDLFLVYARRRADVQDVGPAMPEARARLYAWLSRQLDDAAGLVYTDNHRAVRRPDGRSDFTGSGQARGWLIAAADELTTCAHAALNDGWADALRFADTVAYWLYAGGRSDQARSLHLVLSDAGRAAGDRRGQAAALASLGAIAHAQGESPQAHDLYRQAHDLYQELNDRSGQAEALCGMGRAARVRGEWHLTDDCYRRAHDLYRQIDHRRGQVSALEGLGDVAELRGDLESAHNAYQRAHDLAEQIGYRSGQGDNLCGLATVAQRRGDHSWALAAYQRAHDLYREIGNLHGLAYALKGLGDVARLMGEYRQAADAYGQAYTLYEQVGFRDRQADVIRGMGDVALAGGERGQARDHYECARDISLEIGYRNGLAEALNGLADVARADGDRQRAQQHDEQAQEIYRQLGRAD